VAVWWKSEKKYFIGKAVHVEPMKPTLELRARNQNVIRCFQTLLTNLRRYILGRWQRSTRARPSTTCYMTTAGLLKV